MAKATSLMVAIPPLEPWATKEFPKSVLELEKLRKDNPKLEEAQKLEEALEWRLFAMNVLRDAAEAKRRRQAYLSGGQEPSEPYRQQDALYRQSAAQMAKATRQLARFLASHPRAATLQMVDVSFLLEEGKQDISSRSRNPTLEEFIKTLEALAKSLARPFAQNGAWLHRNQFGPLHLPQPLDVRTYWSDWTEYGLLFGTVLHSRCFTSNPRQRLTDGMPMPKSGKPNWKLAVTIADEALGDSNNQPRTESIIQDKLQKFIKRNTIKRQGGVEGPGEVKEEPSWLGWDSIPPNPDK